MPVKVAQHGCIDGKVTHAQCVGVYIHVLEQFGTAFVTDWVIVHIFYKFGFGKAKNGYGFGFVHLAKEFCSCYWAGSDNDHSKGKICLVDQLMNL